MSKQPDPEQLHVGHINIFGGSSPWLKVHKAQRLPAAPNEPLNVSVTVGLGVVDVNNLIDFYVLCYRLLYHVQKLPKLS